MNVFPGQCWLISFPNGGLCVWLITCEKYLQIKERGDKPQETHSLWRRHEDDSSDWVLVPLPTMMIIGAYEKWRERRWSLGRLGVSKSPLVALDFFSRPSKSQPETQSHIQWGTIIILYQFPVLGVGIKSITVTSISLGLSPLAWWELAYHGHKSKKKGDQTGNLMTHTLTHSHIQRQGSHACVCEDEAWALLLPDFDQMKIWHMRERERETPTR